MDKTRVRFFRCPYCGRDGGHNKKVGKNVGMFRVKELYNNILIFECQKCRKTCRKRTVGSTLQWVDMSDEERKAFKDRRFKEYRKTRTKLDGGKHGTKNKESI